jgi:Methyltransferase domain
MQYWPCWTYFDEVLGSFDWKGKTILDFGGSWGNLLRDPSSTVEQENYWCIDVRKEAIAAGKKDFPRGHFIWYNRRNEQYNPLGEKEAPMPALPRTFDLVLAHSVFTHTSRAEMQETVTRELLPLLAADGRCIITLLLSEQLEDFLKRRSPLDLKKQKALCWKAQSLGTSFYLLSNRRIASIELPLPESSQAQVVTSFYKLADILALWPDFHISTKSVGTFEQLAISIRRNA